MTTISVRVVMLRLLVHVTAIGEVMKELTGKWKWSKKRQAWIMKWKRRKVSKDVHFE